MFKGTDELGTVRLSPQKDKIEAYWVDTFLEKDSAVYSIDGTIHPPVFPLWVNLVTDKVDLYKNPSNQQYWNIVNYREAPNAYWGKNLWIDHDNEIVMVYVGDRWCPFHYAWVMSLGHTWTGELGEEYQFHLSMI
ncbi:hypothetical protein D3C78_20480 [compost metagenome]